MMEIINTHLTDPSQFDPDSKYYDPKSSKESPRWDCVEVKYLDHFEKKISLHELRKRYNSEQLQVVRKGNRLSIIPVPENTALDLIKILNYAI